MISGSNQQLQQELEYTLQKPDCHSWWISEMQSGRENILEEWYTIKLCFKLVKKATEKYGMLQAAFGLCCMNQTSVFEWHKRFKEGRESARDDERCGRSNIMGALPISPNGLFSPLLVLRDFAATWQINIGVIRTVWDFLPFLCNSIFLEWYNLLSNIRVCVYISDLFQGHNILATRNSNEKRDSPTGKRG